MKEPNKPTHGGAREGSGRKPQGRVKVMITLPPELLAKLDRLTTNRSRWVGEKIRRSKET